MVVPAAATVALTIATILQKNPPPKRCGWVLHISEDDGSVDDDFPCLDGGSRLEDVGVNVFTLKGTVLE